MRHDAINNSLLAFVLAVSLSIPCSHAFASEAMSGVALDNPQWLEAGERSALLQQLHDAGVRTIRVPLVRDRSGQLKTAIDFVEAAYKLGIQSLLVIPVAYARGAIARPAVPGTALEWAQPGLSAADSATLRDETWQSLSRVDAQGIQLAGLEFGNEINWAPFNGDFPVNGLHKTLSSSDLDNSAEGRVVQRGLRSYVESLAVLKSMRDALTVNRKTPIIAAGLADIQVTPESSDTGHKYDSLPVELTLDYLQKLGLDKYVDYYAVHPYFGENASSTDVANHLKGVLTKCGDASTGGGKSCWITEWGVTSNDSSCSASDDLRMRATRAIIKSISQYILNDRVEKMFYYDWSNPSSSSNLFRCGHLTPAGSLVLSARLPTR